METTDYLGDYAHLARVMRATKRDEGAAKAHFGERNLISGSVSIRSYTNYLRRRAEKRAIRKLGVRRAWICVNGSYMRVALTVATDTRIRLNGERMGIFHPYVNSATVLVGFYDVGGVAPSMLRSHLTVRQARRPDGRLVFADDSPNAYGLEPWETRGNPPLPTNDTAVYAIQGPPGD